MGLVKLSNRRGQSVAEYATLFAIIIGAAVAMQLYVKRGLQAKQKDSMVYMMRDALGMGAGDDFQYEPYYQSRNINQSMNQNSKMTLENGMHAVVNEYSEISYDTGAYEKQEGWDAFKNGN